MSNILQRLADTEFSRYIRSREADKNGFTCCFICGTPGHWEDFVNMHWQKRDNLGTRYNEVNCQCGCGGCNDESKPENYTNFEKRLIEVYGQFVVEELIRKAKGVTKLASWEYGELIVKYKSLTPIRAIRL